MPTCFTGSRASRALRFFVPLLSYVPYVPSFFLRALRAFIFVRVLRAFSFYVSYVPAIFYAPYVPSVFYVPYVSSVFYMPYVSPVFYVLTFYLMNVYYFSSWLLLNSVNYQHLLSIFTSIKLVSYSA